MNDKKSPVFELVEQLSIVPKVEGYYSSFPTLAKINNYLLLAFRTGEVDKKSAHGKGGKIRILKSSLQELNTWQEIHFSFQENENSGKELDAILSFISPDQLIFMTRKYDEKSGNYPYISLLNSQADNRFGAKPIGRELISSLLAPDILEWGISKKIKLAACFGHVVKSSNNTLLMTCYGIVDKDLLPSPLILASRDMGESWIYYSTIASSDEVGEYLNECSILSINNNEWVAVIRTNEPPFPLYVSYSNDNCKTWSKLSKSSLRGHAPMLCKDENDNVLLLYRDLASINYSKPQTTDSLSGVKKRISTALIKYMRTLRQLLTPRWATRRDLEYIQNAPSVSVAYLDKNYEWRHGIKLIDYKNIYDGGYGDIVSLGNGLFFAVTYRDDDASTPWIDGFIVRVSK